MLHTVGTDNYGWCSKEGMFQCDVKVILVHGPLQKYRGLFYEGVVKWYHAGLQNQKQEFDSSHLCQAGVV